MIYAPAGSPAFQSEFGGAMADLGVETTRVVGSNLVSLVLGGGFGRGEGGVTHASGKERPFNDVDLFLFVERPDAVDRNELKRLEHAFSERLGAEVEYSAPIAASGLARIRPAQMWLDLIHGHQVIAGDRNIFARFDPSVAQTVPVAEGIRLLLNRGAGLVWAKLIEAGAETMPDEDFIRRNVWKAHLALRDAALIVSGAYPATWPERESAYAAWFKARHPRAVALQLPAIAQASRFKVAPDEFPPVADLSTVFNGWVDAFLELEGLRFATSFPDSPAYRRFPAPREPALGTVDAARNLVRNARVGRISMASPRDPLYRALPGLLIATPNDAWIRDASTWLRSWRRWC